MISLIFLKILEDFGISYEDYLENIEEATSEKEEKESSIKQEKEEQKEIIEIEAKQENQNKLIKINKNLITNFNNTLNDDSCVNNNIIEQSECDNIQKLYLEQEKKDNEYEEHSEEYRCITCGLWTYQHLRKDSVCFDEYIRS